MTVQPEKERPALPEGALTPAMRQYRAAKEAHPDALLFFRMGDFYELFFEDAVVASRELQLTLTARDKQRAVPMCGVPFHAWEGYVQRLLRRGFRVAICEQMEDPKQAKGVVRREVTRVLSPGTTLDATADAGESCWLSAVASVPTRGGGSDFGLAFLDLSTGEFRATEFRGPRAREQAIDELERMRPVELLLPDKTAEQSGGTEQLPLGTNRDAREGTFAEVDSVRARTRLEAYLFLAEHAVPALERHLRVGTLDGMGLEGRLAATGACGAVLEYVRRTQAGALEHLDRIQFYDRSGCLQLDAVTVRNLEILEPAYASDGPGTTLLAAVDSCLTPMGRRRLRAMLLRPAGEVGEVNDRLDAVGEATSGLQIREVLRESMTGLLDLERLLGRVALDSAGPRELVGLGKALSRMPAVLAAAGAFLVRRWAALCEGFDTVSDVSGRVLGTLVDEPPFHLADGGAVRGGVSSELDELRGLGRDAKQAVAAIEERERARTGIGSLKVRFNNVFGYYLEVTRTHARSVPADYERKQTLVNAERFTTPELKGLEERILHSQERAIELERAIFEELRTKVLQAAGRIREAAHRVAEMDVLAGLAHTAARQGWTRPVLEESGVLEIVEGRHPVVERRLEEQGSGRFVPNSVSLCAGSDQENGASLALITGPNMGGKSTYLRMAALLVILAQTGSFVPARAMRLGLVDRVFTRIGASDNVARGRSTFMVEMTETAAILNLATERSLVLLDEMGRGTATFDGLSLAWAAVEFLHDEIRARTLFATHYHELTLLAERLPRLRNLRVTVREVDGSIVFLHGVEAGAASKSYGLEVARLAGLPRRVVERARHVLEAHEQAETREVRHDRAREAFADRTPGMQLTMFTPLSQRVVDRIEALDVDSITPREALGLLAELQEEVRG